METEVKEEKYEPSKEVRNLIYNRKYYENNTNDKINTLKIDIRNERDFYVVLKFHELITKFAKPKLYNIVLNLNYVDEIGYFEIEYKKDLDKYTILDIFEEIYPLTKGYCESTKKNFWGKEKTITQRWSKFDWSITENSLKYRTMEILGVERINKNFLHTLLDNLAHKEKYY